MINIAVLLFVFLLPVWGQEVTDNIEVAGSFYEPNLKAYKDVWGYVDPEGREYALLTQVNGLNIIEVTDPANPRKVVFIPGPESSPPHVVTYKHYAYFGVDNVGEGIQIIDLGQLPDTAFVTATYTENNFGSTHNIWIDTTRALLYTTEFQSVGCRIVSLEDPVNPVMQGHIQTECHDFHTADTRPNLLFIAGGGQDVWFIYDVTDPANPVRTHTVPVPGGDTYIHNMWTTKDGNYLVTTEEILGKTVKMWDIRDLDNITLVDEYIPEPPEESMAHNAYIKGDTLYIAYYGQGVRILDITDPTNMVEIGFIKPEYPPSERPHFGAWAVYPFLPSGNILSSHVWLGLMELDVEGVTGVDQVPDFIFRQKMRAPGFQFGGEYLFDIPKAGAYQVKAITIKGTIAYESSYLAEKSGMQNIFLGSNVGRTPVRLEIKIDR